MRRSGRVSYPPANMGLHVVRQRGHCRPHRRPLRPHRVDAGHCLRIGGQPVPGPVRGQVRRCITRLDIEHGRGGIEAGRVDPQHRSPGDLIRRGRVTAGRVSGGHPVGRDRARIDRVVDEIRPLPPRRQRPAPMPRVVPVPAQVPVPSAGAGASAGVCAGRDVTGGDGCACVWVGCGCAAPPGAVLAIGARFERGVWRGSGGWPGRGGWTGRGGWPGGGWTGRGGGRTASPVPGGSGVRQPLTVGPSCHARLRRRVLGQPVQACAACQRRRRGRARVPRHRLSHGLVGASSARARVPRPRLSHGRVSASGARVRSSTARVGRSGARGSSSTARVGWSGARSDWRSSRAQNDLPWQGRSWRWATLQARRPGQSRRTLGRRRSPRRR